MGDVDGSGSDMKIHIEEDGPYSVSGDTPLAKLEIAVNDAGESIGWHEMDPPSTGERYALCRCGKSESKPFCDGSHMPEEFDGTETASRDVYLEQSVCAEGDGLKLHDVRELCAEARFCDRAGGLWNLIEECSDDPEKRALADEEAALCPSGRYTLCDPGTDQLSEPDLEPSIALIEDPYLEVSGPLFVRGGVPIFGANGVPYEVRNRVTLCRCGKSKNKPFCDGSHIAVEFKVEE